MPSECKKVRQEYENLKTLKSEFDLELEKARETGNLFKAKELKAKLEQKRNALSEKLWTFESLPQKELKEQYEDQKEILERVGILEKLSTGEIGIRGIDNKEYAFPTYQELIKRMRENKEMLKTKIEQGFSQLLIVPFGMKLDDLIEKYKQVILKHYQEGKLLATKEKPSDPDEPLELDEKEPVWVWYEYQNADRRRELVYFPEKFSENHQGKTKQEILKKQGGWNILFIEDLPNIPRKDKGKDIKGRKQLEAGLTPNKYLETLKTSSVYKNETGMTPEEQIIYAIKYLEQTNQVIDDYSGKKGSLSFQLGAYFPASDRTPEAYWDRDFRKVALGRGGPKFSDPRGGVRSAVRV